MSGIYPTYRTINVIIHLTSHRKDKEKEIKIGAKSADVELLWGHEYGVT